MKNKIKIFLILTIIVVLVMSCRKELCYSKYHPHQGEFEVELNRSCMEGNSGCEIKLLFYPMGKQGLPIVRFVTEELEAVDVPVGNYHVIAYNNDTKLISFRKKENYDLYKAYLKNIDREAYESKVPTGNETEEIVHVQTGQRTIGQPEYLYIACVENFKVEEISNYSEQKRLVMMPDLEVINLEIVLNVGGLHNVRQVRGVVSDVCSSLTLHDHSVHQTKALSTVFCDIVCTETRITTELRLFSFSHFTTSTRAQSVENNQKFIVDFMLKDGSVVNHSFEIKEFITDDIKIEGGHIYIDSGITLPDVDENGGFDPDVDDWDDEIIVDIPI